MNTVKHIPAFKKLGGVDLTYRELGLFQVFSKQTQLSNRLIDLANFLYHSFASAIFLHAIFAHHGA